MEKDINIWQFYNVHEGIYTNNHIEDSHLTLDVPTYISKDQENK